jgi:arsenite-transporting ATPase
VVSTDAAHSLGDSLDHELTSEPTQVATNLYAQEINALKEMEGHWSQLHEYMAVLFNSQGVNEIIAEELATPPGMEEIASLMWIKQHARENQYDLLIVDCAPTGETLQLLAFPEVAHWYLDRIFPLQRLVSKVARPLMQPFIKVPLPTDKIYGAVQDLLLDLNGMKEVLSDSKACTVRLVMNLEKMVIKEAERAYTYLNLYDYQVDAVLVNRVLPEAVGGAYFAEWRKSQQRYAEQVNAAFSPLPILNSRLFDHEIVGLDNLSELADALYGDLDPSAILYDAKPQSLRKENGGYILSLQLPFASKEQIELSQRDDQLYVSVGPYKREISLPRVLRGQATTSAKMEDGHLVIRFGGKQ